MANRTDTQAETVHGTNPQYLVDRIIRNKIYNDAYWKEFCFGLTTEGLIDEAAKLDYVGGTYGGRRRPTRFLCLFLKMLQIQPDEEVILEYIKQPDLKYLRALGAAYFRISSRHIDVFKTLEPLYADYRKLRYRDMTGKMSIIHMDEFVDWLFQEKTVCDVTMPGLPKRESLEQTLELPPYESVLDDDLEDLEELEPLPEGVADAANVEAGLAAAPVTGAGSDSGTRAAVKALPSPSRREASPPRRGGRGRDGRDASPAEHARSRSRRRRNRDSSGSEGGRRDGKKAKTDKKAKGKKERWKTSKKEPKEKDRKDEEREAPAKKEKKDKDGLSVNEWNEIRKSMGLKPLSK